MHRIFSSLLLGAALITPVVVSAQTPNQERRYYDRTHHDYHNWNDHEDRAYRYYMQQNHREYRDYAVLHARDQQNYWNWRHRHNDAWLQVNVR